MREYQREVRCKAMPVVVEETLWSVAEEAECSIRQHEERCQAACG